MCLGGGGGDGGAAAARREEEARQAKIAQARGQVDQTFGNSFTPEFYDNARQTYIDNYLPQLDEQFSDAKRSTVLSLANSGQSASTSAGRAYGDIQDMYNDAQEKIRNDAIAYSRALQGDVSNAKTDLYGLASTGVDPASIARMAGERSVALSKPSALDPLGDFFGQVAAQNANRNAAAREGYIPRTKELLFSGGGNKAVRNVT